jgi:16S rRNA (guanine966-N2)-methyltransferase
MRVISGTARGRRLQGPDSNTTRPMADKIREALFSVLASLGVQPERVLDLFAGTGAVGIEALSRGGTWADFVDRDAAACRVVRRNLEHVGFADRARVHQEPALGFVSRVETPYDFVILDPPYADPEILSTLEQLSLSTAVRDGTIVVIGHSPRVELPETIGPMTRLRSRCHGDSCFAVYDVIVDDAAGDVERPEVDPA